MLFQARRGGTKSDCWCDGGLFVNAKRRVVGSPAAVMIAGMLNGYRSQPWTSKPGFRAPMPRAAPPPPPPPPLSFLSPALSHHPTPQQVHMAILHVLIQFRDLCGRRCVPCIGRLPFPPQRFFAILGSLLFWDLCYSGMFDEVDSGHPSLQALSLVDSSFSPSLVPLTRSLLSPDALGRHGRPSEHIGPHQNQSPLLVRCWNKQTQPGS